MPMRSSRAAAFAAMAVIAVVAAWFLWLRGPASAPEAARVEHAPAEAAVPLATLDVARATPADPPPREAVPPPPPVDAAEGDDGVEDMYSDPLAEAWSKVDLEAARRAMPDNLYFKMSLPTKDEAVLAERQAERDRWNVEYGKMLSGTGTEEEIRAYYDQRARLSGDYVEFTTYLLDNYRDELPERDVAMLELARRLHLARLEEIPRQVEEARERKRKQDEARAAWLADEAEFRNGDLPP